jgi:HPt (histidine-containing phosphotransfer) domain-containing protein
MSTTTTAEIGYYSSLGSDPDFAEIVALFVDEMPGRMRDMQAHFGCANWDELARLAHQLKGAAGSYGFDQLTPFAAGLEKSVRNGEPAAAVRAALEELVEVCGRVRAGKPAGPASGRG